MSSAMTKFLDEKKKKLNVVSETKVEIVKNEEEKLSLSEKEIKALRFYSTDEDLSIPALVSLVLKDKAKKSIKESYLYDLQLRNLVDDNGEVTDDGKTYLESEHTKKRILDLLEE